MYDSDQHVVYLETIQVDHQEKGEQSLKDHHAGQKGDLMEKILLGIHNDVCRISRSPQITPDH